jgi:hypothetical protein
MKRFKYMLLAAAALFAAPRFVHAQATSKADPSARDRVIAQVRSSGLTSDQIRARLKAMGFSDETINQILGTAGSDATPVGDEFFSAARALGVRDSVGTDTSAGRMPRAAD